jgi:hypothetical protein
MCVLRIVRLMQDGILSVLFAVVHQEVLQFAVIISGLPVDQIRVFVNRAGLRRAVIFDVATLHMREPEPMLADVVFQLPVALSVFVRREFATMSRHHANVSVLSVLMHSCQTVFIEHLRFSYELFE